MPAATTESRPKRSSKRSHAAGLIHAVANGVPPAAASTLPIEAIDADHWPNPRGEIDLGGEAFEELRASIREQGILEPIVVGAPVLEGGRHPIIAGWRRFTAAGAEQLPAVPVHVRADITDARAALRAALAENLAREDMTPVAEAKAIARLMELGDTQAAAAKACGVSERTARERLRLLKLPVPVQEAIDDGTVPFTAGRQLQVIGDAAPDVAVTIAERLKKGTVKVEDLRDGRGAAELVQKVAGSTGAPVVALDPRRWTALGKLPIDEKVRKKLVSRCKRVNYGSDSVQLSLTGKRLGEAKAAGALLELDSDSPAMLVGAEWIELVASAAVDKEEKRQADRQRADAERKAQRDVEKQQTPHERAVEARDQENAQLHARAAAHAAAMNAEIGERILAGGPLRIEGAVARLLLKLIAGSGGGLHHVIRAGLELVAPDAPFARIPTANVYREFESHVTGAETAEHGATLLVAGLVGSWCADLRQVDAENAPLPYAHPVRDVADEIEAVALEHELLPDRAKRLLEGRREYVAAVDRYRLEPHRRRALYELAQAGRSGLAPATLRQRGSVWTRDIADALDAVGASQHLPYGDDLAALLDGLVADGYVERAESENGDGVIVPHLRITKDGRAAMKAPLPIPPLFPDVDAQGLPADVEHALGTLERGLKAEVGEGESETPGAKPKGTRRDVALQLVREHPGITIPELAQRMEIAQNYLYRLLPGLQQDGTVRKEGRGWFPGDGATIVHVRPTRPGDGEPAEAELQPERQAGRPNVRKVIYTASRTASWVAASRIVEDLEERDA